VPLASRATHQRVGDLPTRSGYAALFFTDVGKRALVARSTTLQAHDGGRREAPTPSAANPSGSGRDDSILAGRERLASLLRDPWRTGR
jgi:hypothetical protein